MVGAKADSGWTFLFAPELPEQTHFASVLGWTGLHAACHVATSDALAERNALRIRQLRRIVHACDFQVVFCCCVVHYLLKLSGSPPFIIPPS